MYLTVAWLTNAAMYMTALLLLSVPHGGGSARAWARDLLNGVFYSMILLFFFSSFQASTHILSSILGVDLPASWEGSLKTAEGFVNNTNYAYFAIVGLTVVLGAVYAVGSLIASGATLGAFAMVSPTVTTAIFSVLLTASLVASVLNTLFRVISFFAAFVHSYAPPIFAGGVAMYPLPYTRKLGVTLMAFAAISYVIFPTVAGGVPLKAVDASPLEAQARELVPIISSYGNATISVVSSEGKTLTYCYVIFNDSVTRWVNSTVRVTALPAGVYKPVVWYMGLIHRATPSLVEVNRTNVFMGEAMNIVLKLDGVSAVSPSFIVLVDSSVSAVNESYVVSVPVNGSRAVYICCDIERMINWSYRVTEPNIVVENCTVDVGYEVLNSSSNDLPGHSRVVSQNPLTLATQWPDENITDIVVHPQLAVKKIVFHYRCQPEANKTAGDSPPSHASFNVSFTARSVNRNQSDLSMYQHDPAISNLSSTVTDGRERFEEIHGALSLLWIPGARLVAALLASFVGTAIVNRLAGGTGVKTKRILENIRRGLTMGYTRSRKLGHHIERRMEKQAEKDERDQAEQSAVEEEEEEQSRLEER